jgi:hypothetical protein
MTRTARLLTVWLFRVVRHSIPFFASAIIERMLEACKPRWPKLMSVQISGNGASRRPSVSPQIVTRATNKACTNGGLPPSLQICGSYSEDRNLVILDFPLLRSLVENAAFIFDGVALMLHPKGRYPA